MVCLTFVKQANNHTRSQHPKPYTLHITPYTLYPAPYTLHPTPYTIHPPPYTLYPAPYTLHPTPYTLNANPTPGIALTAILISAVSSKLALNAGESRLMNFLQVLILQDVLIDEV